MVTIPDSIAEGRTLPRHYLILEFIHPHEESDWRVHSGTREVENHFSEKYQIPFFLYSMSSVPLFVYP